VLELGLRSTGRLKDGLRVRVRAKIKVRVNSLVNYNL
jgi:hypothetical protein